VRLIQIAAFALPVLFLPTIVAGSSDLADAVMKRDKEAVASLLKQKTDPNAAQADGTTPLHWAAQWNDLALADQLLAAGAKAGTANRVGATPLLLAGINGSAEMIEKLVKAGADVNVPVLLHGETPLMIVAKSGNVKAAQVLLDHGAQINAVENLRGTTALMWAAEQSHTQMIDLLVSRGADVQLQSKSYVPEVKKRGLGFAPPPRPGQPAPATQGPVRGGLTALLFAVREGSLPCVKLLAEKGSDVNKPTADGSTALLVAVQNGNYDIADYLLSHGADPNVENQKGWTPLYLAVKNKNQETTAIPGPGAEGAGEIIKNLLEHKANPNVRIKAETEVHQGMTSLWLKEAGATPLLRAALCGDLTTVKLLMQYGADPNIPTFDNTTALMVASGVGWADGMLHEYSEKETLELIELLLSSGADVKAANDHGITALHGAGYKGANRAVQLLVDRGADLAAKDKGEDYGFGVSTTRMTPLNWAEGVPIGMSSAIYHEDTVALMVKLMEARGIPVVRNSFNGQKGPNYSFGNGAEIPPPASSK
jgi:uncharacterized protein